MAAAAAAVAASRSNENLCFGMNSDYPMLLREAWCPIAWLTLFNAGVLVPRNNTSIVDWTVSSGKLPLLATN